MQLLLGNCPVLYEEPCDPSIKFILHSGFGKESYQQLINPFKPELPKGFNILTPLKILIHGYGGLETDAATRNVSKAYRDVGYNVITGKFIILILTKIISLKLRLFLWYKNQTDL